MSPQPTSTHDREVSFATLLAAGVSKSKAVVLAERHDAGAVLRTLNYAKAQRSARSPVALAISMLERGDIPPAPRVQAGPGTTGVAVTLCDTLRGRWNQPNMSDDEVMWMYAGYRARQSRSAVAELSPEDRVRSFEFETRCLGWSVERQREALRRLADPESLAVAEAQWAETERVLRSHKQWARLGV
jgi:hypothetical protein